MPGLWFLLVVSLWSGASAGGNFSLSAEVIVSSQALRVRGGEPSQAQVRPLSPRKARAAPTQLDHKNSDQLTSLEDDKASAENENERGHERNKSLNSSLEKSLPVVQKGKDVVEGRGHMKKLQKMMKKYGPYFMVPGFMALGYAPFLLASLKMFVMNSLMLNMMAMNAAIFITLRNMVFGPRRGEHIRYHNYGYKKKYHHRPF